MAWGSLRGEKAFSWTSLNFSVCDLSEDLARDLIVEATNGERGL